MAGHPYQHIMVALNFSPGSDDVMGRAEELAQRYMARLSLIHVVEPVLMEYAGEVTLPDEMNVERQLLESGEARIRELGDRLHVKHADRHVLVGSPKAEIVRVAEEQGVDLIVIGSHGRHGLGLLLGSTANAVMHHAPCDLVAVHIKRG